MDTIHDAIHSIGDYIEWGNGCHDDLGENVAPKIIAALDNAGDITCAQLAKYFNDSGNSIIGQGFKPIILKNIC